LNTIDINLLTTWQQIAIYLASMMGNPITIHSFVVFLRLYWFEKEFQEVAKEATKNRRSIAKTFTKSKEDPDHDKAERGVNGRNIVVVHGDTDPNGTADTTLNPGNLDENLAKSQSSTHEEQTRSSNGSDSNGESSRSGVAPDEEIVHHTQIKFADHVTRSNGMADDLLRLPAQRSEEDHIAILQRQRNPSDSAVLRIPGPRDADAGVAPEEVDADQVVLSQTLSRRDSNAVSAYSNNHLDAVTADDRSDRPGPPRRNITIQEPARRIPPTEHVVDDAKALKHAFSPFAGFGRSRRSTVVDGKEVPVDGHIHGRKRANTFNSIKKALTREKEPSTPYLSWQPTIGRNSAFIDLTEEQREELGGVEYRSLKSLAMILTCYYWGFSLLGVISLVPWILQDANHGDVVRDIGQGRVWWGIFTANTAFTDLGFTLTPNSMISFQSAIWPLFLMSFLIIIGNTGFPIMLRIIIWITSKWVPRNSGMYEETRFLLDHPRRCFTLLFPSKATWWLFWILVLLNGVDLLFFIILDVSYFSSSVVLMLTNAQFGNSVVTQLPVNIRVLDGWFQAVSTRTAGLAVVDLSLLHPAIQVSYLVMMYISVLPIAISVRRTNVYEEQSLGLYGSPEEENAESGGAEPSYVGSHLRRQLSFDLWYIFLGFFIITIAEGNKIQAGQGLTMFGILFEIVSAYGTVGLSLGFPGTNTSLSAQFTVISKLVIIAMQVRGRHRGLPYALDKAIMLPNRNLEKKEQMEAAQRARRRSSFGALPDGASMTQFPTFGGGGIGGPISSGAVKQRGTSRSSRHQAQSILSDLLHIGPALPDSIRKLESNYERQRRHSVSEEPSRGRMARSVSPSHMAGTYGTTIDGSNNRTRKRQVSGRRHFFEEGVNEPPAAVNAS
jgi:potassium uptake Trk family protein